MNSPAAGIEPLPRALSRLLARRTTEIVGQRVSWMCSAIKCKHEVSDRLGGWAGEGRMVTFIDTVFGTILTNERGNGIITIHSMSLLARQITAMSNIPNTNVDWECFRFLSCFYYRQKHKSTTTHTQHQFEEHQNSSYAAVVIAEDGCKCNI